MGRGSHERFSIAAKIFEEHDDIFRKWRYNRTFTLHMDKDKEWPNDDFDGDT